MLVYINELFFELIDWHVIGASFIRFKCKFIKNIMIKLLHRSVFTSFVEIII